MAQIVIALVFVSSIKRFLFTRLEAVVFISNTIISEV